MVRVKILWGGGCVLRLDCVTITQLHKFAKLVELYTILKWVSFMVCNLYLNKAVEKIKKKH